ncbi:MAG: SDR family NAD(P)-dependent oxidoreductase [Halobacteriota archaeon]
MGIELDGHTAIITGAGRGIGRAIAHQFAEANANVVAAARTETEIEQVAEQVADEYGVESLAVPTDLRNDEDIHALVDTTVEELGTPTILVNNAGANLANTPPNQTVEEIDTMIDVNFRAVFMLSVYFAETFRESDAETGRIIGISSMSGPRGNPSMALYGGTKTGMYGLTRGLAAEYARDGITVNTVSPATTRVERTAEMLETEEKHNIDGFPIGRPGEPEDVSGVCLCLASDYFGFVTGEDIRVDGGVGITSAHRKK